MFLFIRGRKYSHISDLLKSMRRVDTYSSDSRGGTQLESHLAAMEGPRPKRQCASVLLWPWKQDSSQGLWGQKQGNKHSKQLNSAAQFRWLLLDFPFSSCESINSMLFFHNPTSLGGFEVDGVAAGPIATPVEGHDDEAVLREGWESWYCSVAPVPGERQRVFVSMFFLWIHQSAQMPPAYLHQETDTQQRDQTLQIIHMYACERLLN